MTDTDAEKWVTGFLGDYQPKVYTLQDLAELKNAIHAARYLREETTMEPTAREQAEKRLAEAQEAYRKTAAKAARAIERRGRAQQGMAIAQAELDRVKDAPREPTETIEANTLPSTTRARFYPAVMFTRGPGLGATYIAFRDLQGWRVAGRHLKWEQLLDWMGRHGRDTLRYISGSDWKPIR